MTKRRSITGAEVDVFSRWRRVLCYLDRPGVTSGIKRQARRRERREAKGSIRRNPEES